MSAIHVSVPIAPVRGALNHGDHGTAPIKVLNSFVKSGPKGQQWFKVVLRDNGH